ncbi:MAG: enoyl-CoA hydratase/isomerase family protein, partial [Actinomycetota bacterium]|nr:enoyl-CoA hydratase/isomerase family protein [Actinomycetota bacterium]
MHTSAFAPAPGHSDSVLYAVNGRLGRVRLNRPRVVNALDAAMVDSMLSQLRTWAQDEAVRAVFLDGAGERGLCAGGDVRALRESLAAGRSEEAMRFWSSEYALNALVADYPKPYVAWMDGVVMGGGVGVSAHGSHRLVTERSKVAMPETIIGFFPDVGTLWLLSRSPGELGTHAALTGLPVDGTSAVTLGLADVVVRSADKDAVLDQLADALGGDPAASLPATSLPAAPTFRAASPTQDRANPGAPEGLISELARQHGWIDECYAGDDAVEILRRLREHDDPAAAAAGAALAARSPHSVAITLEALRRAADMDVSQVLEQDAVLGRAFAGHPDFAEGVRALLVDRDNAPRWVHAELASVSRDEVL